MWNVIASLLALAAFSIVVVMTGKNTTERIRSEVVEAAASRSGYLLSQFAVAAHSAAVSVPYSSGTMITPSMLISNGFLPQGFPDTNSFGQSFRARVGTTSSSGVTPVISWNDGDPRNLFGLPMVQEVVNGVQSKIAQYALSGIQEPGVFSGVARGATLSLPFVQSSINLSTLFPGWGATSSYPVAAVIFVE